MNYETLLMYSFVSFFYIISPGPAIFLAIYNGAVSGTKPVMASAFGNVCGLLILSSLSVSGLSAILLASSTLFMIVKIIGASYLIYLGIKQLRSSKTIADDTHEHAETGNRGLVSFFKEGLIVAATNPKPILFFAALFPQFIETESPIFPQFVVMTVIFMLFSFLSLTTYGYLAQRAKGFLSHPGNVRWFHRISGTLFVGMGVSLFQVKS